MDPFKIIMKMDFKLSILSYTIFQYSGALLNALPLQHQFQCFRSSGHYQLCLFPDDYCDDRHSECRPCSKDICDKLHANDTDFPLQCAHKCSTADAILKSRNLSRNGFGAEKSNCSISGAERRKSSVSDFIQDNPMVWFILFLVLFMYLLISLGVILWKTKINIWLKDKQMKRKKSDEEVPLVDLKTSDSKEIQTDMNKQVSKGSQTEFPGNHPSNPYCEGDNGVVITTTASQRTPSSDTTTTVDSGSMTASNENLKEQTHTKAGQNVDETLYIGFPRCSETDLDSTPLHVAPSLNPATLVNDIVSNV